MKLKPNRYYEVTNGLELTFADVKCQYFIGQPPTNQITASVAVAVPSTTDQDETQDVRMLCCICVCECVCVCVCVCV